MLCSSTDPQNGPRQRKRKKKYNRPENGLPELKPPDPIAISTLLCILLTRESLSVFLCPQPLRANEVYTYWYEYRKKKRRFFTRVRNKDVNLQRMPSSDFLSLQTNCYIVCDWSTLRTSVAGMTPLRADHAQAFCVADLWASSEFQRQCTAWHCSFDCLLRYPGLVEPRSS
ncbi:hypothetical protein BaRGS_00034556 [Batillaria attramentaria]|uniref:Uncharacterized protein n=1 Tax=Batillaria attramentaria TaxID=370345 RepID=A0ABD0JH39_9CAEN